MSPRATEEDRNLGQYRSKNSKEDFASASDNGKPIVDIMSETNENRIGTLDPRNKRRARSSFKKTLFLITKEGSKLFNFEIAALISSWMRFFPSIWRVIESGCKHSARRRFMMLPKEVMK